MLPMDVNPQMCANYTLPSILSTATLSEQDAHRFVTTICSHDIEMPISIKIAYRNTHWTRPHVVRGLRLEARTWYTGT